MYLGRICFPAVHFPKADKIYVFGGKFTLEEDTYMCECYDIENNQWDYFTSMPSKRYFHDAIQIDEKKIYIIGGYDHKNRAISKCIEVYDIEADAWRYIELYTSFKYFPHNFMVMQNS